MFALSCTVVILSEILINGLWFYTKAFDSLGFDSQSGLAKVFSFDIQRFTVRFSALKGAV